MVFTTRDSAEVPSAATTVRLPLPVASLSFGLQRRAAAPFASIGLVGLPQTESATGTAFSGQVCVFSHGKDCPKLAGIGVRSKRLLGLKNINVYTLGLYVDGPGAKRALRSKHQGREASSLASNQRLYDDVTKAEFEKTLRIVINFGGLSREKFISTLDEAMQPPMQQAGEVPMLDSFKAQFDEVKLQKGTELLFSSIGKGKLLTQVNGKQMGVLESPALVHSLFSIYLGPNAVSPEAKSNIGQGLVELLNE